MLADRLLPERFHSTGRSGESPHGGGAFERTIYMEVGIMPSKWTKKEERQYEHIKESQKDRGKPTKRAKEIAARTVNKTRRERGETPNRTTSGTGNPTHSLEDRSKQELYNRAKQLDIDGRSKMNKKELVRAIRKHE